jgi:uncharacterized protein with PQ loop repeat
MAVNIHHLHKRKRIHEKSEKYPHPKPWIRFLDNFLLVVAVIGPLANIPQIIKIFTLKSSTGVSTWTFAFYAIFNIPWIIYGIVHKEKPIVIAYVLWLITNSIVIFGTFIYP